MIINRIIGSINKQTTADISTHRRSGQITVLQVLGVAGRPQRELLGDCKNTLHDPIHVELDVSKRRQDDNVRKEVDHLRGEEREALKVLECEHSHADVKTTDELIQCGLDLRADGAERHDTNSAGM